MDMSIARELEGQSSIEGLDRSSIAQMKQLELIAVMVGSCVMNCVRHLISCSDGILKYICRKLFEFADVSISENEKSSASSEIAVKARIATVNHTCKNARDVRNMEEIEEFFLTTCHPILKSRLTSESFRSQFRAAFPVLVRLIAISEKINRPLS